MFESFLSKFKKDELKGGEQASSFNFPINTVGLEDFFSSYSGSSFNQGLYRFHSFENISKWNKIVSEAFPSFSQRIFCFGYDWLGRQFALDLGRSEAGEPLVFMFEPGTGEALEIPVNFAQFHEDELVNYTNEALAVEFFSEWLATGNEPPASSQCVGYKKPLFLGGADIVANLELIDLEVYWGISGQLLEKVRGLPPGTPISNITIK
ncbi:T6SS immunity protein Tdi1 domain-containing protein [Vibrio harveyi]|uniref:T6SS immunity protein Tdi1 domain-containing protein n=1 Tax=Vibrio harveyi TaxID=669 RepID=UPI0038CD6500